MSIIVPPHTPIYASTTSAFNPGWHFSLNPAFSHNCVQFMFDHELRLSVAGTFEIFPQKDCIDVSNGIIYLTTPPSSNLIEDVAFFNEILPIGKRLYRHKHSDFTHVDIYSANIYMCGKIAEAYTTVKYPIYIWNKRPSKQHKGLIQYNGHLSEYRSAYILDICCLSFLEDEILIKQ